MIGLPRKSRSPIEDALGAGGVLIERGGALNIAALGMLVLRNGNGTSPAAENADLSV
ncbi:hypothetical protein SAMN05216368_11333 [Cryobacterium flavum]|uniref:Uncharacterized protein n=1 Tax=Cryobacterium flavum TaxID=1424659 RepID=A0A5E9G245_9MICO|nr:hypothetical protein SAMN05216368_11333 [Cryobacterium flavum]